MILPSKHLPQDRALLTVGGHVLTFLARPKTVSALWDTATIWVSPAALIWVSCDIVYFFR